METKRDLDRIDMEEELSGKRVHIEVLLKGLNNYYGTNLYFGTYAGRVKMGEEPKEFIVLRDAHYYNKAGITFDNNEENQRSKINSPLEFISLKDILSIGLDKEDK